MPFFTKKPIDIEAIKYTGLNGDEIAKFMHCQFPYIENTELKIRTLEGVMSAQIGDWIIKGIKGEFYPCKPDIFEATYNPLITIPSNRKLDSLSICGRPECIDCCDDCR